MVVLGAGGLNEAIQRLQVKRFLKIGFDENRLCAVLKCKLVKILTAKKSLNLLVLLSD